MTDEQDLEDPEDVGIFDEENEYDLLSEPSSSLSISNDILHHLMPPPKVPTLDLRRLRLESQDRATKLTMPRSARSTKPPPQPQNHGLYQDEVFFPANRPENFIHPNKPHKPPPAPDSSKTSARTIGITIESTRKTKPAQQHTSRVNNHRKVRPSTTDPGTLTARHSQKGSTFHTQQPKRPSSTSTATRNKRKLGKAEAKMKRRYGPTSSTGTVFGASTSSSSCSSSSSSFSSSAFISPRLEEISKSPEYKKKSKVFGPNHVIQYNGKPPRLAYYYEEHPREHHSLKQILPHRNDHPENPENTPTLRMNRPKLLSTLRKNKQLHLEQAAKRGELHAVAQLKKQKEDKRLQMISEKRKRAFRRSLLMAKLDRFANGSQAIRNRASNGSGGTRLDAKMLQTKQKQRLNNRAFIYREWDEYRDQKELENTDTVAGRNTKSLRKTMDEHDTYVEEHAVLWTPRTQMSVLAEERLVKELIKNCKDKKIRNRFESYKPAVSHGDTRKIIGIKRAGNRYLEELANLRMNSIPDDGEDSD
jgi:hypothetical protein